MSAGDPQGISKLVERRARSLHASGHPHERLVRAIDAVHRQDMPLRDAIVLREAERLAEQESPAAVDAWAAAQVALRSSVPDSTFNLWLRPLEPIGANGDVVVLAAPDQIRSWVERRYSRLIDEALRAVTNFTSARFVPQLDGGQK